MDGMKKEITHKFKGKQYRLRFVDGRELPGKLGECDEPTLEPEIRITVGQKPRRLLTTIIHECLHACHWKATEKDIVATSWAISGALTKLGYKKRN